MSSETARARRSLIVLALVTVAAIGVLRGFGRATRPASPAPADETAPTVVAEELVTQGVPATGSADPPAPADASAGDAFEPEAFAWAQVDLDAVRDEMPDNLFWTLSAPTTDARVLRDREETRAEWNRRFGRVQANLADEAEVRDYFALRQRISADAVEFSSHLLDRYRDVLPERDVGLLELARTLHLARLEEMPARLSEALERRRLHEEERLRWLEEERAFREGEGAGEPGDAPR
ncbi:MAG: hypothetical protein R3E88_12520 [Myxococcota bacterium]